MKQCPNDAQQLITEHRFTIEVDVCPKCQGIWLDRDELNKILSVARGEPQQKSSVLDDVDTALHSGASPLPPVKPSGGSAVGPSDSAPSSSGGGNSLADFFGNLFDGV